MICRGNTYGGRPSYTGPIVGAGLQGCCWRFRLVRLVATPVAAIKTIIADIGEPDGASCTNLPAPLGARKARWEDARAPAMQQPPRGLSMKSECIRRGGLLWG